MTKCYDMTLHLSYHHLQLRHVPFHPLDRQRGGAENGSSCCDLSLNSQNFFRSILAGAENPSLSRLCYQRLWESRNRRALILGWVYYLDAFNNYPLRT
ncbi:hypothetical protein GmHk_15G043970 [Glycine max]|nr:hypothetical protein GmHk_15G043970 [Glycine max]